MGAEGGSSLSVDFQTHHPANHPPSATMNLAIRLFAAVTLLITMLGLGLGLPRDSLQLWLR